MVPMHITIIAMQDNFMDSVILSYVTEIHRKYCIALFLTMSFGLIHASDKQLLKNANKSKENAVRFGAIKNILNEPSPIESQGNVENLTNSLTAMNHRTPQKSKKIASGIISQCIVESVAPSIYDLVEQNKKIAELLASGSDVARLLVETSKFVGSPEKRAASCVYVNHIVEINRQRDRSGNTQAISGGHNLSKYNIKDLSHNKPYDCFVGQDNETIGVYVDDKYPKTTRFDFDEAEVVDNLRNGTTIAQSPTNPTLSLSQSPKKYYCDSYKQKNNELIHLTQYPVFTIDSNQCDSSGNMYVGKFARFSSDLSGFQNSCEKDLIRITIEKFNEMMHAGTPLDAKDKQCQVVDITVPMTDYCYDNFLKEMGKSEMPGKIYGIRNSGLPSLPILSPISK